MNKCWNVGNSKRTTILGPKHWAGVIQHFDI